jgi:hypothetical protein
MIGTSQYYLGEQAGARSHFEHVLAHFVAPGQRSEIIRFEGDEWAQARAYLARTLWPRGLPDQAMRTAERSVADARSTNHAIAVGLTLLGAACPIALWADYLAATERYVEMLHAAFAESAAAGSAPRLLAFLISAVSGHAALIADGPPAFEEAIVRSEHTEERWLIAELLRVKGEIHLWRRAHGAAAEAESHFRRALNLARQQGALSWELRAATSLARLWRDQTRSKEAHELLAPVYDRFTEGVATADLKEAKRLLEELV